MPRAKKSREPKVTKSGFVRELPAEMPAAEVVKKAKEHGMTLSIASVYTMRSQDRARSKRAPKKGAKKSIAKTSASKKKASTQVAKSALASLPKAASKLSAEDLLRYAVLAVGLFRATQFLAEERWKLRELLGG